MPFEGHGALVAEFGDVPKMGFQPVRMVALDNLGADNEKRDGYQFHVGAIA